MDPEIILDPQQEPTGEVRVMWVESGAGQGHGSPNPASRCLLEESSLLTSLATTWELEGTEKVATLHPRPKVSVTSHEYDKESWLPHLKRHLDGVLNHTA